MISALEVRELIDHTAKPGSGVLSVYLNVDQSQAVNLNRGFEAALRNLLRVVEEDVKGKDSHKEFIAASDQALRALSRYTPHGRVLVMFAEPARGFFWQREVNVALENGARWSGKPYIRPLLEAFEEFKRYGIVLIDKGQARLFTLFLSQIEEHVDALAADDVKHIKGPGTDHLRSQMQVQRKADGHARHHLKNVAELLEHLSEQHQFDHIVLAGPVTTTSELQGLLPTRLRKMMAGTVPLAMDATPNEIMAAVQKLQKEVERSHEEVMVGELITAAAKNIQAVTGLEVTLQNLHEGRVWRLVYANGFKPAGGECGKCGYLFSQTIPTCLYCQGSVQPVKDVLARAVSRVVNSGGKVEQVREKAAEVLKDAGGVGAFLRF